MVCFRSYGVALVGLTLVGLTKRANGQERPSYAGLHLSLLAHWPQEFSKLEKAFFSNASLLYIFVSSINYHGQKEASQHHKTKISLLTLKLPP